MYEIKQTSIKHSSFTWHVSVPDSSTHFPTLKAASLAFTVAGGETNRENDCKFTLSLWKELGDLFSQFTDHP